MTISMRCPPSAIATTLHILRKGADRRCEALALWLGRRRADGIEIVEVFEPPYRSAVDFFHITPEGMRAVMTHLRQRRLFIAAQVHSHPGPAFHSTADDEWAIVRHEGALSIVIPHFATTTDPSNFIDQAAVFCLAAGDRWLEISRPKLAQHLEISDALSASGK